MPCQSAASGARCTLILSPHTHTHKAEASAFLPSQLTPFPIQIHANTVLLGLSVCLFILFSEENVFIYLITFPSAVCVCAESENVSTPSQCFAVLAEQPR